MSTQHLSEQEQLRREKLAELIMMGIEPYPAALFPVTHYSQDIKQQFTEENKDSFNNVCLAGRLMSVRDMGKANFAVIQDGQGKIQLYVRRDDICPGEDKSLYDVVWKKLVDLGLILKPKHSTIPVVALNIISDESDEGKARVTGKKMMEKAVSHAASTGQSIIPLTRFDMNTSNGIIYSIMEQNITDVVIGLHKNTSPGEFFGST